MKSPIIGLIFFLVSSSARVPSLAVGKWVIGKPYSRMGQPFGLDAKQERFLRGLIFTLSPNVLKVCGKEIPITTVKVIHLAGAELLERYGFEPEMIGFSDGPITEVDLNLRQVGSACGPFSDPGTDLLLNEKHAVVVIENDYFRLERVRGNKPD